MPGDYIAGFVDGEGCFSLRLHKDVKKNRSGTPVYYFWKPEFCIVLRIDDKSILEQILASLNCGRITVTKRFVRYSVQDTRDLITKIIPFFEKFPLRAKKKNDYILWVEAIKIIYYNLGNKVARDVKENNEVFQKLRVIHASLTDSRMLFPA